MNGFKWARERANMNQLEAAEAIGVTGPAVCMWETGRVMPKTNKLNKIAEVYGCTIAELLVGEVPDEKGKSPNN